MGWTTFHEIIFWLVAVPIVGGAVLALLSILVLLVAHGL
jgi:hypothetical protein